MEFKVSAPLMLSVPEVIFTLPIPLFWKGEEILLLPELECIILPLFAKVPTPLIVPSSTE
jgi:hypothetical protein